MNRAMMFLKVVLIGGLTLVTLLALWMVDGVISSRQEYRDEAKKSIAESFASEQRVMGPVLVQPYRQVVPVKTLNDKGVQKIELKTVESTYSVFPRTLTVTGALQPSIRRHGLYRVPVYEFEGTMAGHFDVPPAALKGEVQYGVPYLAFAVKDARGIVGTPVVRVNGVAYAVAGATETAVERDSAVRQPVAWGSNVRAVLPDIAGKMGGLDFSLDLAVAGTEKFELVPVADSNRFELSSAWTEPLFAGQFLPHSPGISADGFHAVWEVSSLASATQHQLMTGADHVDVVNVSLTSGIDAYRLAERAVKYGILFVMLTFGGFFLFELVKRMLIHPVQYLLVGFCLAVFFLLLVSFSEHMAFGAAYLIASGLALDC